MLQNCHERDLNCFRYGKRLIIICLFTASLIISCKKSEDATNDETISPEAVGGGVLGTRNQPYIGVNYNESFQEIRSGELSSSKTKWVRGFIDVLTHYENQDLNTNAKIAQY